jgi:hypothetical protein
MNARNIVNILGAVAITIGAMSIALAPIAYVVIGATAAAAMIPAGFIAAAIGAIAAVI